MNASRRIFKYIAASGVLTLLICITGVQSAAAFSIRGNIHDGERVQSGFLSNTYCSVVEWFGGSCDNAVVVVQTASALGNPEISAIDDEETVESSGSESDVLEEIDQLKKDLQELQSLVQESGLVAPVCSSDDHASREDLYSLVKIMGDLAAALQERASPVSGSPETSVTLAEIEALKEQLRSEIQLVRVDAMSGSVALGIARSLIGAPQIVGDQYVESPSGYTGDLKGSSLTVSGMGTSSFAGGVSIAGGGTFGGMISTLHNGIFGGSLSVSGDFTVDTNTLFVDSTNNRVGIGTTTPEESLDVTGSARIGQSVYLSDYTPTSGANRLYSVGGDLYWDGSPVIATPTPPLWTESGSDVYRASGNVGIGTTTPQSMLALAGGSFVHTPDSSSYQEVGTTTILSSSSGGTEISHLTIQGRYGYMYVNDNSITPSVYVYDFLDPERPVKVGSVAVSGASYPLSLSAYGDYVYLANQSGVGINIIHTENKKNPTLVSTFSIGSQITDVKAYQGFLYAEDTATRKLYVIDVRQPESPKLASQLSLGAAGNWGFDIAGGFLYILEYGWLDVVDVSDPYNLDWRGWVGLGYANQIKVSGDMAYVISGSNDRMQIIDVSDPDAPVLKSQLTLGNNPYDFEVEGGYAYVLDTTNRKVSVVNVASSSAPYVVRDISMSSYAVFSIDVEGPYMYVAEATNYQLHTFSIPSIKTPVLVSSSLHTGDVYVKKHLTVYGNTHLETLLLGKGGLMSFGRGTFLVDQPTGSTTPPALTVVARDARSNTVTDVLELAHYDEATPEDGIGTGIVFKTDLDSGEATTTVRIASITTDVSAGTPASALAFYLKSGTGVVSERMRITSAGYVGIGTSSPTAQLTTTGSVRFATFGTGSLQTDANGNLLVSSDERLKDIENVYERGLDAVLGLSPIMYRWKQETGFDTKNIYTGFSAQNVQEHIPEAVGESRDGFLTLADRPIVAAIVNAIKELNDKVDQLSSGVVSQLGSIISVDTVKVEEVCWDDLCVSKDEMRQLLQNAAIVPASTVQDTQEQAPTQPEDEVVGDVSNENEIDQSQESGLEEGGDGGVSDAQEVEEAEPQDEVIDNSVNSQSEGPGLEEIIEESEV